MAVDIERAKAVLKETLLALAADDADQARASLEECRSHLRLFTPPTDERERDAWSRDMETNGFPVGSITAEFSKLDRQATILRLMIALQDRSAPDFVATLSQLANDAISHFSVPHGDPAAIEPVAHAALALKMGDLEHQTVLCMHMAMQFAFVENKPKAEEWLGRMPESESEYLRRFQTSSRARVDWVFEQVAKVRQSK